MLCVQQGENKNVYAKSGERDRRNNGDGVNVSCKVGPRVEPKRCPSNDPADRLAIRPQNYPATNTLYIHNFPAMHQELTSIAGSFHVSGGRRCILFFFAIIWRGRRRPTSALRRRPSASTCRKVKRRGWEGDFETKFGSQA